MYIKEFYKNKKQNIHIIIIFLIIIICIYLWSNYFSKSSENFVLLGAFDQQSIPTPAQSAATLVTLPPSNFVPIITSGYAFQNDNLALKPTPTELLLLITIMHQMINMDHLCTNYE